MATVNFGPLLNGLTQIRNAGWIESKRNVNNWGAVGNTLEDLLHVKENNFALPDFDDWELKSQDKASSSLLTLLHNEPEPRSLHFVPQILLKNFGWAHPDAGTKYPADEMRISLTINNQFSDRGFCVKPDSQAQKIYVEFDMDKIGDSPKFASWKNILIDRGVGKHLEINPYWDFSLIQEKMDAKLKNAIYIKAEKKKEKGKLFFKYQNFLILVNPSINKFVEMANKGHVYVDFDARTHHNHGTKMRIKADNLGSLYDTVLTV